eukprot:CAMPEP_0119262132 /NCGR_PEP_ID=MMETSP1329-20130426/1951_1 /TAXON_ID=114041 /ORGANISM="Genus nov. species nov., Strain RCC1024" /LENGTH=234 /DNA_ID=CAMNT_0007261745 /DNA_START=52 /DNA_END=753 /DNA_ORIENTATION=+
MEVADAVYYRAKGVAFTLLLAVTAFAGSVFVLLPAAALLLPFRAIGSYRDVARAVRWWWFSFAGALLELGGARYVVTGADPPAEHGSDRVVLVISNHHCRLDWMFLWPLAARHGRAGGVHITLKDALKHIPLFGWAMQAFGFAFLSRVDRAGDVEQIRARLGRGTKAPLWALIFPEGTDLSESNVRKSRNYGRSLDPPRAWDRVLIPRGAGAAAAVEALGDRLDAVYDVTLAYA